MIKNFYFKALVLSGGILCLGGCSSLMSHSGGKEGLYPGTRANTQALGDSETSWAVKPLVILDLPFSAVMDTVLLPWDMYRKDNSLKSRVETSEKQNMKINSVIPPAKTL
ncbi:YceK/YidQ family lipoprotein [Citrobacter sp. JGM124]|uniref:YceK/YidQ family lipoprotein n=1 Tax=Citrobacter sp. JGM124 TaxID=2799789 RepID=UPI001BA7307D|nr:YceK/YidQ family lipoprotein [Citrobacter sp. JGM124]MBS0848114.1 YceK/YidQ family lipoprotein [Citrobacter sp. JGM124]